MNLQIKQDFDANESFARIKFEEIKHFLVHLEPIYHLLETDEKIHALEQAVNYGETVFHHYAYYNKLQKIQHLLNYYTQPELQTMIMQQSKEGRTCLHYATRNPECLELLLKHLPSHKHQSALMMRFGRGISVLHSAALCNETSFNLLMKLLSRDQHVSILTTHIVEERNLLYFLVKYPATLKLYLPLFTEQQLYTLYLQPQIEIATLLHHTAYFYPASFHLLLNAINHELRNKIVLERDFEGHTVLHASVKHVKSFNRTLALLPIDRHISAIFQKNKANETVLQLAAYNPKVFKIAFHLVEKNSRPSALLAHNNNHHSVFHAAACDSRALIQALMSIPENQRLRMLFIQNMDGDTVLNNASYAKSSLQALVEWLPMFYRWIFKIILTLHQIANEDKNYQLMSHEFYCYPKNHERVLANDLFNLLRKQVHVDDIVSTIKNSFDVIFTRSDQGNSIFQHLVKYTDCVSQLVKFFSRSQRKKCLFSNEKSRVSILHEAAALPGKTFHFLWSEFSFAEMSDALNQLDYQGRSLLHSATTCLMNFNFIVTFIDQSKRIDSLLSRDQDGNTVFHLAVDSENSFVTAFELIPMLDRHKILFAINHAGVTVLRKLFAEKVYQNKISTLLPESDRWIIKLFSHLLENGHAKIPFWRSCESREFKSLAENLMNQTSRDNLVEQLNGFMIKHQSDEMLNKIKDILPTGMEFKRVCHSERSRGIS